MGNAELLAVNAESGGTQANLSSIANDIRSGATRFWNAYDSPRTSAQRELLTMWRGERLAIMPLLPDLARKLEIKSKNVRVRIEVAEPRWPSIP